MTNSVANEKRGKNDMIEQLRALRKAANLTQKQVADKLGVVQSTVALWETGRAHPRATMLPKIADTLGCTVDELLRGSTEKGEGE